MLQSIAFDRLTSKSDDGKLEAMMLTDLGTASAVNIGKAVDSSIIRSVQAAESLVALGYDKSDPIVQSLMESGNAVRATLQKIGDVIPGLLSQH
jgi:hypothetical protein